ncbi:MAG: hypothetical protein Q8N13_23980 [Acidovorax sp.]|nr:hypothetical protein [Acidovorax sp.]
MPLTAVASRLAQAAAHPAHAFLAHDCSVLDASQVHWQHLLGPAVRHQCCFVSFDARLNLHVIPGAGGEHLISL